MPQYHHHQRRQLYNSGMNIAGVVHHLPLLLQLLLLVVVQHDSTNHVAMVQAVRNVQVVFPLQSLTIWDPEVVLSNRKEDRNIDVETQSSSSSSPPPPPPPPLTFRAKFLSKFQKGLQAEVQTRNMLLLQQQEQGTSSSSSNGNMSVSSTKKGTTAVSLQKKQQKHWATQAALNDQKKHELRESIVEQAYDNAIQQHQKELEEQLDVVQKKKHRKNPNRYQFVGVINHQPPTHSKETSSSSPLPPITWYTRTKPKHAKWTIRLIHVNRAAILKDLYNQKKIDIFAQYQNKGTTTTTTSLQPQVTGQYRVRERSWKNLWNMSLKHMLTDSSGMYWRERRIHSMHGNDHQHPNLYTDGNHVYEATYRYIPDGRNGMHKVSTLTEFLNSRSIDPKIKQRIVQRLQNDTPDIVLEE